MRTKKYPSQLQIISYFSLKGTNGHSTDTCKHNYAVKSEGKMQKNIKNSCQNTIYFVFWKKKVCGLATRNNFVIIGLWSEQRKVSSMESRLALGLRRLRGREARSGTRTFMHIEVESASFRIEDRLWNGARTSNECKWMTEETHTRIREDKEGNTMVD